MRAGVGLGTTTTQQGSPWAWAKTQECPFAHAGSRTKAGKNPGAHSARALDKRTSAPDASAESGAPNASEAWSGPEPTEKAPVLVIATDSCDGGLKMALHNRNT